MGAGKKRSVVLYNMNYRDKTIRQTISILYFVRTFHLRIKLSLHISKGWSVQTYFSIIFVIVNLEYFIFNFCRSIQRRKCHKKKPNKTTKFQPRQITQINCMRSMFLPVTICPCKKIPISQYRPVLEHNISITLLFTKPSKPFHFAWCILPRWSHI